MDFATKVSLLIFLPALALPLWLWWMAGRVERRIEEARYWPRVPATVTATRIGRGKGTFWPIVHFQYDVKGVTYHSKRLGFVQISRTKAECEKFLTRYPVGKRIEARHDPRSPGFAVIEASGNGKDFRTAAYATGASALVTFFIVLFALR